MTVKKSGRERTTLAQWGVVAPDLLKALKHVDCYPCHLCGHGYGEHTDDCIVGLAIARAEYAGVEVVSV